MAKRRRLSGPFDDPIPEPPLGTKAMPFGRAAPIASVAAEASEMAALHELAAEVTRARNEGRIVQGLSLDAIDAGYLVRDRIGVDEAEMEA